jgi:hypothetical protein
MKAHFPSELNRQAYHVADVSDGQVMVVVNHTAMRTNLYVSQLKDPTGIHFALSLEQIFCYFPNSTWMGTWLRLVSHLLKNEADCRFYPHIQADLEICHCSHVFERVLTVELCSCIVSFHATKHAARSSAL